MEYKAEKEEILTAVRDMNRIWTESWDENAFGKYIHPDAVAIAPTTPGRLVGRQAYVGGWKQFVEMAKVLSWIESDPIVSLYASGRCAVVTYLFTIIFSVAGQEQVMKGRDMLFLVREGDRWLVTADQFSPEPVQG